MTRTIRAILFDLGDTLLDFGKVDLPRLFDEGAKLAYEYLRTLGGTLPAFGRYRRRHLRAIHWHEFLCRLSRREFNSLHVMDRLCRRMNLRLNLEQLLEVCWLWYEPLSRQGHVEGGVADLLRNFREEGLKIGMVSNTFIPGQVLDRHLSALGLLDYLPVRVYSCDVGRRKPNPRVFSEALRRMAARSDETIFVGDSPKADVHGANRMGMISVLKDPLGRYAASRYRPNHTIKSLLELPGVLAQYNQENTKKSGDRRGIAESGMLKAER
ncbi:MAG: HAD family hydrolase [Phycisphaerae bacterium]|nr:HAD family hydrolase [Phycisphaerae bacterium]